MIVSVLAAGSEPNEGGCEKNNRIYFPSYCVCVMVLSKTYLTVASLLHLPFKC